MQQNQQNQQLMGLASLAAITSLVKGLVGGLAFQVSPEQERSKPRTLTGMLSRAISEEIAAIAHYEEFARRADALEDAASAALFRFIQKDEEEHRDLLGKRLREVQLE